MCFLPLVVGSRLLTATAGSHLAPAAVLAATVVHKELIAIVCGAFLHTLDIVGCQQLDCKAPDFPDQSFGIAALARATIENVVRRRSWGDSQREPLLESFESHDAFAWPCHLSFSVCSIQATPRVFLYKPRQWASTPLRTSLQTGNENSNLRSNQIGT
jgi:hypothetical protein